MVEKGCIVEVFYLVCWLVFVVREQVEIFCKIKEDRKWCYCLDFGF